MYRVKNINKSSRYFDSSMIHINFHRNSSSFLYRKIWTATVPNSIKSQLRKKSVKIISNHDRVAELSGLKNSQRLRQEVNCFWFRSRNHCLIFVFPQLCQSIGFSGKTRPQSRPGADIYVTFATRGLLSPIRFLAFPPVRFWVLRLADFAFVCGKFGKSTFCRSQNVRFGPRAVSRFASLLLCLLRFSENGRKWLLCALVLFQIVLYSIVVFLSFCYGFRLTMFLFIRFCTILLVSQKIT